MNILFDHKLSELVSSTPAYVALIIALSALAMLVAHLIFSKIHTGHYKMHKRFLEHVTRLIIIIICLLNVFEAFDSTISISQILWRGSALVVAVVGFAAQPAIADLVCGFLITINKPFDIGDRIIVDGLEPGIVEDINLRHTVLTIYDGMRIVIPNSQLNSKFIINTSYHQERRGIHLTFHVSFDTDVNRAAELIRDAVASSPYTLDVEVNGYKEDSGPVYFLRFDDSSLVLETTVFIKAPTSTYIATTDVNIRVLNLFRKNGIEIPYDYLNVLTQQKTEAKSAAAAPASKESAVTPSKRHFRSDTVKIAPDGSNLKKALDLSDKFAAKQRMSKRDTLQLRLLCEETLNCVSTIVDSFKTSLWIDGSGLAFKVHVTIRTNVDPEAYQKLISLSSSGKNAAVKNLSDKIHEMLIIGTSPADNTSEDDETELSWSLREYEEMSPEEAQSGMSQTILATLADDVRVSVLKDRVEMVVFKDTRK